jgi:VCBS repeat protein/K319-like protein
VSPLSSRGIVAADFNKDGRADIALANRGSNEMVLYAATADGTQFRPAVTFPAGTGSRAIVAADIDGDGKPDVVTGNEYVAHITLFSNRTVLAGRGAVAFELHALPRLDSDVAPQAGALAAGDFNRNGIVDVVADDAVVLDGTTAVRVAVDRPQVTYGPAIVGDFNRDGHLDFARAARIPSATTASGTADVVDVFLGDGAGGFTFDSTLTFDNVRALWAADVNGDQRTDFVVWNLRPDNGFGSPVLEGIVEARVLGDVFGRSTVVTLSPSDTPVGIADMNGDHRLDLVVWDGDLQAAVVWTQTPVNGFTFGFESQTAGEAVTNAVLADLDEDGVPDVVGIGRSTNSLIVILASGGGFNAPAFAPIASTTSRLVIADFDADGRLDYLADDGTFATGHGDGTFTVARQINLAFRNAVTADVDGDALPDVVLNTADYAAMVLFNRGAVLPNLPPVADAGRDITVPYQAQFGTPGVSLSARRSYDPNLDPLTYQWLDASGVERSTSVTFNVNGLSPGTYVFTLVVRDSQGAAARDAVAVTITGSGEIVAYAESASYHGVWSERADPTAAGGVAAWAPNANAPKLNTPLANPANYVEFAVHPDPTLTYKLWLRLKAEANNWANDSVFVQFDGAVDASGTPVYQIGSTSALSVNLEECVNCGVSGWGWRDDAWGAKGLASAVLLRFPPLGTGITRIRIQTREDGVMVDQVVLSSNTFKTRRPGAAKNDTVILPRTEF